MRGRANGTVSAYAYCRLGDITTDQFRGLADIQRDFGVDVRITNRQNFVLRGLTEDQLPDLYDRLAEIDMAEPGAELARDVVALPRRRHLQPRGHAVARPRERHRPARSRRPGSPRSAASASTSPAARTRCGQHHISDIGFFGLERRAHGRAAPGYQMLLGGHVGRHGDRVRREGRRSCRRRPRPRPSCGSSGGSPTSARPARRSPSGSTAPVAPRASARRSRISTTSPTPDERPRLLRRLRRDRSVRGRGRRQRVRDMTALEPPTARRSAALGRCPISHELAAASRRLETQPASAAIEWAWNRFGTDLVLAASFQDCVLIDSRSQVAPGHRGRVPRHAVPLRRDALVRRAGPRALRPQPDGRCSPRSPPDDLWHNDPDACCARPQGRAARSGRSPARPRG